jgi:hypothetical protein
LNRRQDKPSSEAAPIDALGFALEEEIDSFLRAPLGQQRAKIII